MRKIMEGRELELFNIISPYIKYPAENGQVISNDAPAEVLEAYEEYLKIKQSKEN